MKRGNNVKTIEYFPWSEFVLNESIIELKKGALPCLDIELSGICDLIKVTGGCIYCDSYSQINDKYTNELKLDEIIQIIKDGKKLGVRWVYICGLGEPLNDPKFFDIISFLRKLNINVSLFSNGIYITEKNIDFLFQHSVNLILKCDSLDSHVFNKILGGKNAEEYKLAQKICTTITKLLEHGYSSNPNNPSLAVSIVPTKYNITHIPSLLEFCLNNNIFPLLGELECAGRAKKIYSILCPTNEQLKELHKSLKKILREDYKIPICPAAVAGLHLNNIGDVIIHKDTGINCGWFSLRELKMVTIGNIRTTSLRVLFEKVQNYRKNLYDSSNLQHWIKKYQFNESKLIFGGCGGKMLTKYFLGIMTKIYGTNGGGNK